MPALNRPSNTDEAKRRLLESDRAAGFEITEDFER
jgi:hypothetical protein